MDLREIGTEVLAWINLAQDRDRLRALVNTVMNLRFHTRQVISWIAVNIISYSSRSLLQEVMGVFTTNRRIN
jgi:hypothetical protein